jgi:Domain of unknown function DUF1828
MTDCRDISTMLARLADLYGWDCRPVPGRGDVVELSTGRTWHDDEQVRLLLRVDGGDTVVVSDGGRALVRLRDVGFDLDDPLFASLWAETLRTYRLGELDDRLYVQADMSRAAHAVNRLADAVVAVDALRVVCVPKQVRGRSLADEVEDYLRSRKGITNVQKTPGVPLRHGLRITPSMTVDTPTRNGVLIQAGATSSKNQAFDHVFTTFGLVDRSNIPMNRRLAVLGGTVGSWNPGRLRALSEVTFVGFWAHPELFTAFLLGERPPDDPVLVPPGMDVPMY